MFVWNLYLYTVKRSELCTSHTVANINSIHLKLVIKKKILQLLTKILIVALKIPGFSPLYHLGVTEEERQM